MTATCTPGLPSVVRFLVSSISLPAFPPVNICNAASGCGSDGVAGLAGAAAAGAGAAAGLGGAGAVGTGAAVDLGGAGGVGAGAAAGLGGDGTSAGAAGLGAGAAAAGGAGATAGLGAAAAALGERITIVFSKSSAGALAAAVASITYFILYLPISITSLFCRMCFLTWLPLTSVPFVLPKSSRKESARIVTIQACSPLTARFSI